MRVLGLTRLYPTPTSPGQGIFNRHQISNLPSDIEVSLVVPKPWTHFFSQSNGSKAISTPTYFYPPGVLRHTHGQCLRRSFNRGISRLHLSEPPNLIYSMFAYPDGWAASRIAHEWKRPLVLKIHGSDIHQLSSDPKRRPLLIEALRAASHIVSVSNELAERVRDLTPVSNISVVRNGIDLPHFSPSSKEEHRKRLGLPLNSPLILYAGRLERVKGVDLLPQIAGRLSRPVQWAVVGGGSLSKLLREQWTGSQVYWAGPVPHEKMKDWYIAADCVVMPSRNEGIPNGLLEAFACDRPVVASQVGGIPEVVGDLADKLLVSSEDVEGFAGRIEKVLSTPADPGEYRSKVENLTWQKSGEELGRVLREAAS